MHMWFSVVILFLKSLKDFSYKSMRHSTFSPLYFFSWTNEKLFLTKLILHEQNDSCWYHCLYFSLLTHDFAQLRYHLRYQLTLGTDRGCQMQYSVINNMFGSFAVIFKIEWSLITANFLFLIPFQQEICLWHWGYNPWW